jgi:diamine N-acetyltransferase
MQKVTIQNNLILRALEPKDLDLLYQWENDPEIWRVSNTINPFSKYILQKYIENSHLDIYQTKQLRLIIDCVDSKNNHISIGTVDLFDFDPYHLRAGIGILIGNKDYRNKGFAKIALSEIIKYSFDVLQLHQLFANITVDNESSMHVFKKMGFIICGIKKDWIKIPGGYLHEATLQLLNESK